MISVRKFDDRRESEGSVVYEWLEIVVPYIKPVEIVLFRRYGVDDVRQRSAKRSTAKAITNESAGAIARPERFRYRLPGIDIASMRHREQMIDQSNDRPPEICSIVDLEPFDAATLSGVDAINAESDRFSRTPKSKYFIPHERMMKHAPVENLGREVLHDARSRTPPQEEIRQLASVANRLERQLPIT